MKKCVKCGNMTLNDALVQCFKCGNNYEYLDSLNDDTQWWYSNSGERRGPYNSNDITAFIKREEISREDLIWTNGMLNWEPIILSQFNKDFVLPPPLNVSNVDNNYVWILAFLPLFYIFTDLIIPEDSFLFYLVPIILNSLFWVLDSYKLRKAGYKSGKWYLWGLFIIPVYLFIRAYKMNKKYGYAITWIATFIAYILIGIIIASLQYTYYY